MKMKVDGGCQVDRRGGKVDGVSRNGIRGESEELIGSSDLRCKKVTM